MLYITARRCTGNVELAQEATQGAMERFLRYRAYERVHSDRSAVAYLVQTAVRLVTDHRRRQQRELTFSEEDVVEPEAEGGLEVEHEIESLLRYVAKEDREVLEMVLAGYSVGEMAERLGVAYSAAAMRVHRAKNRLRARVQEV